MDTRRPPCTLTGTSGNVYQIIATVSTALKDAGMPERAADWRKEAMSSKSYDAVIALASSYVEVE